MSLLNTMFNKISRVEDLTNDLQHYFKNANLTRIIRKLIDQFGESATLKEIYSVISDLTLPIKEIDGEKYIAGYSGPNIVAEGDYKAKLIEITSAAGNVKLCFGINVDGVNRYLYYTAVDIDAISVVDLFKVLNDCKFTVRVEHEVIHNIRQLHATIVNYERM